MKKPLTLTLVLVLALTFLACGNKNNNSSTTIGNGDSNSVIPPPSQGGTENPSSDLLGDEYQYRKPIIPDGMSSDPQSFQISLDGNIVTLPALYSDFTALGCTFEDTDGKTLKPGFVILGAFTLSKNDFSASVNFINLGGKELPLSECSVNSFSYWYDTKSAVSTSIVLPGGLHIGSTVDEIIAAYGEPTERDDSRHTTKLEYKFGDNSSITFVVDKEYAPYRNTITIKKQS